MEDKKEVFDSRVQEYEEWFERNRWAYLSELELLRRLLPKEGRGLEVGVGTGRFAGPLGIKTGVDISEGMLALARERGIETIVADAHNLPFGDNSFDYALLMVTICFVDDPERVLEEIHRVLVSGGVLVVGIVDKASPLGQVYLEKKERSPFYRYARFFSTDEVIDLLRKTGFEVKETLQTLFTTDLSSMSRLDEVRSGHGEGGFVGIKALKG